MRVLFYDRKNKRNVTNDQLMSIKLLQTFVTCDDDDEKIETGRRYNTYGHAENFENQINWEQMEKEKIPRAIYPIDKNVGELGYKSESCPKHHNWDMFCMVADLVFLGFEEDAKG